MYPKAPAAPLAIDQAWRLVRIIGVAHVVRGTKKPSLCTHDPRPQADTRGGDDGSRGTDELGQLYCSPPPDKYIIITYLTSSSR